LVEKDVRVLQVALVLRVTLVPLEIEVFLGPRVLMVKLVLLVEATRETKVL